MFTIIQSRKTFTFLLGVILTLLFSFGCTPEIENAEIRYEFSASGVYCFGINYGWLNEAGETEICHDRFTGGDVTIDCPVPNSIRVLLENTDSTGINSVINSYISVGAESICIAQCEIWFQDELIASEQINAGEDTHIANCQARIN